MSEDWAEKFLKDWGRKVFEGLGKKVFKGLGQKSCSYIPFYSSAPQNRPGRILCADLGVFQQLRHARQSWRKAHVRVPCDGGRNISGI